MTSIVPLPLLTADFLRDVFTGDSLDNGRTYPLYYSNFRREALFTLPECQILGICDTDDDDVVKMSLWLNPTKARILHDIVESSLDAHRAYLNIQGDIRSNFYRDTSSVMLDCDDLIVKNADGSWSRTYEYLRCGMIVDIECELRCLRVEGGEISFDMIAHVVIVYDCTMKKRKRDHCKMGRPFVVVTVDSDAE